MGVASTLFYNSNDLEAEMLYSRISPTEEQMTEQRNRWNNLADFLVVAFKRIYCVSDITMAARFV